MARKACDYCGTQYEEKLQRCPLCGSVNENPGVGYDEEEQDADLFAPSEKPAPHAPVRGAQPPRRRPSYVQPEADEEDEPAPPPRRRGGAHAATKEDAIPKWISVLICVFLTLAVLIGAVFALYSLDILMPKEKPKTDDSTLVLPLDPVDPQPEQTNPDASLDDTAGVCTGITLSPQESTLTARAQMLTISALVQPADCDETVVWSSEDESVATVDQKGIVRAVGSGSTNIVAVCGDFSAKSAIKNDFASDAEVQTPAGNASLSSEDFTLFTVGETAKLTVNNAPDGASVVWASSDPAVATVSGSGTVTAVKSGTTTVSATVGTQTLKCVVRCNNLKGSAAATDNNAEVVGGSSLSHEDVTLGQGESFRLTVTGSSSGHNWSVSNGAVCSVDGDGNVKGLGIGTATISTTVGGETLKCIVRVN